MLLDMGLDASSEEARKAIGLVRNNATWHSRGPWHGTPVFAGEVEPCINGRVVTVGSHFGLDATGIIERLLGEQMADGGWNCERENGSTRGSFHTTINVLEGLLEHGRATGGSAEVNAALERGQEYLLERRMLRVLDWYERGRYAASINSAREARIAGRQARGASGEFARWLQTRRTFVGRSSR